MGISEEKYRFGVLDAMPRDGVMLGPWVLFDLFLWAFDEVRQFFRVHTTMKHQGNLVQQ